jgi:predicted deacylase
VHPDEFDLARFARGKKHTLELEFTSAGHRILIPVLLQRGAREGKALAVTAGVHGDEYEGVRAILDVVPTLDPAEMAGDLVAVPVANPPAFWSGTRTSPLDGDDLARSFPGDLGSGPTRAIAYYLAQTVIACADFFLDLHSGGVKLLMPTMVGYDAKDPRSRDAARAFGAGVLWGHPTVAPGRTISFAQECGIPWVYTEARGAGRIHPEDLRVFEEGILNLLRHLSVLPGRPAMKPIKYHLYGDGNTDASVKSTRQGFLISCVELLEKLKKGQELGRLVDLHGNTIETFLAPSEGVVAMIRQFPVVEPDAQLFLLTGLATQT